MMENAFPRSPILLVDDETEFLTSCDLALQTAGINNVITLNDSRQVMPLLSQQAVGMMVLDLMMPQIAGDQLLTTVTSDFPDLPVIVLTGVNELETAVHCMRSGASDYLVKPIDPNTFIARIRSLVAAEPAGKRASRPEPGPPHPSPAHEAFSPILTRDPAMRAVFDYIAAVAATERPVMITGETGTGKELIARAIHAASGRRGEFVTVNVAGLDDTLFTDTLFGHRKGAFTGAESARPGLVEKAAGGTLFLDEIGDLMFASQTKLLRLLQENEYHPLGADEPRANRARILVATNHDIRPGGEKRRFRQDLYYRLNAHHIHLPPLRERRGDIPLLVEHFLAEAAELFGKAVPTPSPELFTLLAAHHFPGNVRELQGMVYDAVVRHTARKLSTRTFRQAIFKQSGGRERGDAAPASPTGGGTLGLSNSGEGPLPTLKESERLLIAEALKRANGNRSLAAELLGLSRFALQRRLERQTP